MNHPAAPELNQKDIKVVAILFLVAVAVVLAMLCWAATTINAQEKAKEYKLSEVQQLRLQVMQKDALLMQAQLRNIEKSYQDKVSELMSTAQKYKLENGWPPDTTFNPDNLVFGAPPPKEEKK